jgi:hypothetical protein
VRVTLTTDFGTADGYVGAVKGVLATRAPAAIVVDVTHEIPRHDVAAGAFALATAAPWFPDGTIHVAIVDPGVGGAREAIVLEGERGHRFVGPDNGVLALACPRPRAAHAIHAAAFRAADVAPTFHGRDVFAVAAAALAGGAAVADAGPAVTPRGRIGGADDGPRVVHVDRWGNLVTDLPAAAAPAGARVWIGNHAVVVRAIYEDVAVGELVAYAGSAGTIEIALREGDAAAALGLRRGAPLRVLA